MNWVNWLKAAVTVVGGILGYLFGEWAMLVAVVVGLMVIDYITGIIAAVVTKTLSSRVGYIGILKKALIMVVIAMAALLDFAIKSYVSEQLAVCLGAACFFYTFNESLSVLENLGRAGVAYPAKLKEVILALNQKAEQLTPEDPPAPAEVPKEWEGQE